MTFHQEMDHDPLNVYFEIFTVIPSKFRTTDDK